MTSKNITVDSEHFSKLLGQVTRIADALQLQQEINLATLQHLQQRPRPSPEQNSDVQTCKALIMAANRVSDSFQTVSDAVDTVNAGRAQTQQQITKQIQGTQSRARSQEQELDAAISSLQQERRGIVRDSMNNIINAKTSLP